MAAGKRSNRTVAPKKKLKPAKTIGEKVIAALTRFGEQSTDRLARRIGHNGASVSSACSRLFKANKIKRTDKTARGRGGEAVWAAK